MSKDFSLTDVDFLTSGRGNTLLEQLANEDLSDRGLLSLIPTLRKDYDTDETSAAIETAKLRRRAVDKFGDDAARMLFTSDALQQASDPLVRRWRASHWIGETVDVCCSIGTDTLAFVRAGHAVTGVDIDPIRIAMARWNADVLGLTASFVVADATANKLPEADALFYDPARRDSRGRRIYDVEQYIPPLSLVDRWQTEYSTLAVKLSPGIDVAQVAEYPARLAFVSVNGNLKEAELRFGADRRHVAVLLTDDAVYRYQPRSGVPTAALDEPRRWLCEPDPAVIRAGYVAQLATELDGTMLDGQIAYFTTDMEPDNVWVRAWEVLDWMPFHLKRLRAYLREHNVGTVTVKKRGSPLTPEGLTKKLRLSGDESRTLVLTRLDDAPIVLICADYVP